MKKVFIIILLSTLSLNAQSKLFPNIGFGVKLEQTIIDNQLKISDPDNVIYKVLLYNKATYERTTFENHSNDISIDLNAVLAGLYTAMVYVNGDVIVLKLDVKNSNIKTDVVPGEVVLNISEKTIKFYRIVISVNGTSEMRYNVFSETRKNDLINKNIFDITTYTGRKNKLLVLAVYTDNSEELVYQTEVLERSKLYNRDKDLANSNDNKLLSKVAPQFNC